MNKHVVVQFRQPLDLGRDRVVNVMAGYLVAAILTDGLDTSSDIEVISCLMNTPERFQSRVVLNHMDDALYEAKQTLIARELGDA